MSPGPPTPSASVETARLDALVALLAVGVVACMKYATSNDEELPDDDDVLLEEGSACSNFLFEQAEPTDLEQEEEP